MAAKKVLIIEDNELNLKLFRDILGAHDIDTIEIRDGVGAHEKALNEKPDLIILDIQLPQVSGFEVAQQLKAHSETKAIPVIAVTAFAMRDDEERIIKAGCEAYISKPIAIGHFMENIQKFLKI